MSSFFAPRRNWLDQKAETFENDSMPKVTFPRMIRARQEFPAGPKLEIPAVVRSELKRTVAAIKPGARIAVAVGSRGKSRSSRPEWTEHPMSV
jgi:hypothetical protein